MKSKMVMAAAAALSLVTVSSAAVAQSVPVPATETVSGDSEIKGSTAIVALLALTAVVFGAIKLFDSNKKPTSP